MNQTFKKGDRVRVLHPANNLEKDEILTVYKYSPIKDAVTGTYFVFFSEEDFEKSIGWFSKRFELVETEKSNQELANEFRKLYKRVVEISDYFAKEGYTLHALGGPFLRPSIDSAFMSWVKEIKTEERL